jgi:hypothetical protein
MRRKSAGASLNSAAMRISRLAFSWPPCTRDTAVWVPSAFFTMCSFGSQATLDKGGALFMWRAFRSLT